jgi:hypothetical protein
VHFYSNFWRNGSQPCVDQRPNCCRRSRAREHRSAPRPFSASGPQSSRSPRPSTSRLHTARAHWELAPAACRSSRSCLRPCRPSVAVLHACVRLVPLPSLFPCVTERVQSLYKRGITGHPRAHLPFHCPSHSAGAIRGCYGEPLVPTDRIPNQDTLHLILHLL